MGTAEIKIFEMNDCEWYAAENAEDAKKAMAENLCFDTTPEGIAAMVEEYSVEPVALDAEALERSKFRDEGEPGGDDEVRVISFRKKLDEMIAAGEEFPCFFASTEY